MYTVKAIITPILKIRELGTGSQIICPIQAELGFGSKQSGS